MLPPRLDQRAQLLLLCRLERPFSHRVRIDGPGLKDARCDGSVPDARVPIDGLAAHPHGVRCIGHVWKKIGEAAIQAGSAAIHRDRSTIEIKGDVT